MESIVIIAVVAFMVLKSVSYVDGGLTSSFVRQIENTIDMPLDSDVFSEPPGYNAPQQVCIIHFITAFLS